MVCPAESETSVLAFGRSFKLEARNRFPANGCSKRDFAGAGQRGNAGSNVHGDTPELVAHCLALACMQARTDLDPKRAHSL